MNEEKHTIKVKQDKLLDLLLEGKISQDMYDKTSKELSEGIEDIEHKIAKYDVRIEEYYRNLVFVIKVAENSLYRLKVRGFDKKRVLIKMLISNFFIDGCKMQISLKKSLETIVNFKGCPTWLRGLNMGRTRDVLDLLELGKNVSNLMQRLRTEHMST